MEGDLVSGYIRPIGINNDIMQSSKDAGNLLYLFIGSLMWVLLLYPGVRLFIVLVTSEELWKYIFLLKLM